MERDNDPAKPGQTDPAAPVNTRRGDEPTVVRIPRQRDQQRSGALEPELGETVQGSKPGSRFVRITRPSEQKLRRVASGEFEATRVASRPETAAGRVAAGFRRLIIGQAMASSELSHQRLSKVKALAIFSSDALSSSAYATEEILLVLILAGTGALTNSIPIALSIALLTFVVVISYQQTIRAYPNGGGAYVVANANLGFVAAITGASALLVDYIMTVAVSTAAAVAAITSALPELHGTDTEILLALFMVILITLGNLRGIRESGTIFAIPTYFFIFSFGGMLLVGLVRIALGADLKVAEPEHAVESGAQALTLFLLLRAFSSGAAALTGIEAVANGVPSFQPPEARNASITQAWMAVILMAFFVGTTLLAHQLDIVPSESITVIAQIAEAVFGKNALFYTIQVSTALILFLAANTAFAGLPTLASVMARDSVMPRQFTFRGDRLAFSNGIIMLGIASSLVLIAFKADTHKIIPLYAFGVFTAFTISQAGMIVHWQRHHEANWKRSLAINAVGATATAVVTVIVAATKFTHGAWLSILIMIILAVLLWLIKKHYDDSGTQLDAGLGGPNAVSEHFYAASAGRPQTVIVPVEGINRAVLRTLAYARSISASATAIHVTADPEEAEALRERWHESVPDVPLVIVESPYRSLVEPIIAYIEALDRSQPNQMVTVVLPEFRPRRFWQRFLHNQLSLRLKRALANRANTVLVDVPYHLR